MDLSTTLVEPSVTRGVVDVELSVEVSGVEVDVKEDCDVSGVVGSG